MRFFAGFLTALLVLAAVAVAAVQTGAVPANADRSALPFERVAARTSLNATIRREAPATAPFQPSENDYVAAARLYVQNCAVCHGTAHSTPSAVARGLYIAAPQFAEHDVTDDPVGATYWRIAHGIAWTAMPSYGKTLGEREQWQLAWFLKNQDTLPPAAQKLWEHPELVAPPTPLPPLPRATHEM